MTIKNKLKCFITERRKSYLLDDEAILDSKVSARYTIFTCITLSLIVLSLIIWSACVNIKEIAKTSGEIVPENQIRIIQHLHGGIVSKVYIKDGQLVKKGQALLKLDPASISAELEKNIIKVISLVANRIRLEHQLKDLKLSNEKLLELTTQEIDVPIKHKNAINKLIEDEIQLHEYEKSYDLSEIAILKDQIAKEKAQLQLLNEKKLMLKKILSVMDEEKKMYEKLRTNNVVSRREFLIATRQFLKIKTELMESTNEYFKQQRALLETQNRLKKQSYDLKKKAATDITTMNTEILQLRRSIEKLQSQYDHLILRSPVDGLVHGLSVSPGSVIKASDVLVDIVPSTAPLIVEAKIPSSDIGHVKASDSVKIKITAYDYTRYGMISGKLKSISPSTYIDEKTNQPYYKGIIYLDKSYLGSESAPLRLLPGMSVEADIYTGEKSLLAYMLKPVSNALSNSFTER